MRGECLSQKLICALSDCCDLRFCINQLFAAMEMPPLDVGPVSSEQGRLELEEGQRHY